jgi:hypothetical protein
MDFMMLRCQAQLEPTLMMCLGDRFTFTSTIGALGDRSTFTSTGALSDRSTFTLIGALNDRSTFTSTLALNDRSTFTSTSALSGRHDGSSPLFFWRTCCLPGVCVFARPQVLSPPPIFSWY